MPKRPVYKNVFEYLEEHYKLKSAVNRLTRSYKKDIEDQYVSLDGPVNPEKKAFQDAQVAAEIVGDFAMEVGADLVGFTKVKDDFVFEGAEVDHRFAVVLGMEMNYELICNAPAPSAGVEALRIYWRLGAATVKLAEFIRSLGYSAKAHHPRNYVNHHPTIQHTLAAYEAGLGEVGRNGLLITEKFGPRLRLATVTTELELPQTPKKSFGVDEYCQYCRLCEKACMGGAIPDKKEEIDGILKYTVDWNKCLPYFAEYDGCAICISVCVFNRKPDELKHLISQLKSNEHVPKSGTSSQT